MRNRKQKGTLEGLNRVFRDFPAVLRDPSSAKPLPVHPSAAILLMEHDSGRPDPDGSRRNRQILSFILGKTARKMRAEGRDQSWDPPFILQRGRYNSYGDQFPFFWGGGGGQCDYSDPERQPVVSMY